MIKVVSNTTPITSLLKISRADLLRDVFGRVVIPTAVEMELLDFHPELPPFIEAYHAHGRGMVENLAAKIDSGEAEAITLAKETKADLLLIDDKNGRSEAEKMGVRCLGVLGVLLLAKRRGVVPKLSPILDDLKSRGGFYLPPKLYSDVLIQAEEYYNQ